jgi:hypothetical protein
MHPERKIIFIDWKEDKDRNYFTISACVGCFFIPFSFF